MRIMESFEDNYRVDEVTGCFEWLRARSRGYGKVTIGRKQLGAHRVAYERAFGPIPKDLQVCHRCDNPGCVNPDHLFLGTGLDNHRDKAMKRRSPLGERNGRAIIGADQVRQIRAMAGELPKTQIAARFGIGWSQVARIIRGDQWKHLAP